MRKLVYMPGYICLFMFIIKSEHVFFDLNAVKQR